MRDPDCDYLFFRLPLGEITYVKFVFEAYEGLGQMTSLPRRAEVLWVVPRRLRGEAEALARALAGELLFEPIPPPADWPDTPSNQRFSA